MYCPGCGRQAVDGQRFCKSCGFNLLSLSQTLGLPALTPEQVREDRRRRDEVRQGIRTLFTGIGLMIFFALFFHSTMFAAIGAMVFFIGAGRIASATVFATPPRSMEMRWPGQTHKRPLDNSQPIARLPVGAESPPPSVTEHTTVRLDPPEYDPRRDRRRSTE